MEVMAYSVKVCLFCAHLFMLINMIYPADFSRVDSEIDPSKVRSSIYLFISFTDSKNKLFHNTVPFINSKKSLISSVKK